MQYGDPDGLRAATAQQSLPTAKSLAPRMAPRPVEAVRPALDTQTVAVPTHGGRDRPAAPGPLAAIGARAARRGRRTGGWKGILDALLSPRS